MSKIIPKRGGCPQKAAFSSLLGQPLKMPEEVRQLGEFVDSLYASVPFYVTPEYKIRHELPVPY